MLLCRPGGVRVLAISDEPNKMSTCTYSDLVVLSVVCSKHLLCLASKRFVRKRRRHLMIEVCLVGAWRLGLNLREFPLY